MLRYLSGLALLLAALAASSHDDWAARIAGLNMFFAPNDNNGDGLYLPVLGNGYLAHQIGADSLFVAGVYNNETTSPAHRARIPPVLNIEVGALESDARVQALGAALDVERATYFRRGELFIGEQSQGWFEQRWYAHGELFAVYVMELEVHPAQGRTMALRVDSKPGTPSVDFNFREVHDVEGVENLQLLVGTTTIPETPETPLIKVAVANSIIPTEIITSEPVTRAFFTAVRSSVPDRVPWEGIGAADVPCPVGVVLHDFERATKAFEAGTLYSSHVDAWAKLWIPGFEIEGRPDVAIAANASLFAILAGTRADWVHGLAPGGLTQSYNGHSFWDTETWMYPGMLMWHPEIALSLLHYRYDRIPGARLKAQSYSPPYEGAMFAWESSLTGVETCPTFAATGLIEVHISSDISLAVWQYWKLTQDKEWMHDEGYPLLREIATYWKSRIEVDADGSAHIRGVIPPDEYAEYVDDSVYTNYVTSLALRFASEAAMLMSEEADPAWNQLAEALVILFDEELQIHPEFATYEGQVIKQADIVLLPYPLEMPMSEEVRTNDLEFYSERTDHHGPAMTWGMHMIGYRDIGKLDLANKYFNMSFEDNMHEPFYMWTETPDGNAINFITGAGGFLQTLVFGWPGLRLEDDRIALAALCPEGATRYKLRSLAYRGSTFDLEFSCAEGSPYVSSAAIVLQTLGNPLQVSVDRATVPLALGEPVHLAFDAKLAEPARFTITQAM